MQLLTQEQNDQLFPVTVTFCAVSTLDVGNESHPLLFSSWNSLAELSKPQPPEELMDLLVLLYEFQNPRLTAEVLASIRSIRLSNIRMTALKCFILSSVLSCAPKRYMRAVYNE